MLGFFVFFLLFPPPITTARRGCSWDPLTSAPTPGPASPRLPPQPASTRGAEKAMEGFFKKKQKKKKQWIKVRGSNKNKRCKCSLCNGFYPSNTFHPKAKQKWVFLFGNNSGRATLQLLQSRCCFLSPPSINGTPTRPPSALVKAAARHFEMARASPALEDERRGPRRRLHHPELGSGREGKNRSAEKGRKTIRRC